MNAMLRAMNAERLKLRGTLAVWLCVLTPLIIVLLGTMMAWSMPLSLASDAHEAPWRVFINNLLAIWAGIMLPLLITLETALLAGLEHNNHQWKHLLALPLPRSAHYVAKLAAMLGLTSLATLLLCLLIPLGGLLIMLTANSPLAGPPEWEYLCGRALATIMAALPMIAVQMFIAIRWRSSSLAMISGITGTLVAMLTPKGGSFGELFPWALPATAVMGDPAQRSFVVIAGFTAFLVIAMLGARDFSRREYA